MAKEKRNRIQYSPEYINYVESGESAAVFIVRDLVKGINTHNKWIDILDSDKEDSDYRRWNFRSITAEIFPRTIKPNYPEYASADELKYITWETAHKDIEKQRRSGKEGNKDHIRLQLYNKNEGKYETVEKCWNRKFEQYVPLYLENDDCEMVKVKESKKPDWSYRIMSISRL